VARFRQRWKVHQHRIAPERLVFLDETWIRTDMTRLRGWFMRGTALVAKVPHGHWKTLTFIGGLRQGEIVASCVFDGPINAATFTAWVEQSLVPTLKPGDVVVLDNLSSHKDPRARRAIRAVGAHLLFLPPYSPMLPTPPSFACRVGVDGPLSASSCQTEGVADLRRWRTSVEKIARIGMDTSKHVFQLHGVDANELVVLRRKLRRTEMLAFFAAREPTVIGIEACAGSHHWARELSALGHEVKLLAPQLVKPYVKRSKNDAADAEALCEAMSRPSMRFVPAKTTDQQAALMLVALRDRLVRTRTQLTNAIRGHAAEFGLIAAKGLDKVEPLLVRIAMDESLPALARAIFTVHAEEYAALGARLRVVEAELIAWHRANATSRRLSAIPGIGPVIASLLVMKTPDPHAFRSGRAFAAWLGLTPKDHSTAGKTRHGGITRAGDEALRSALVVGATAVINQARRRDKATAWLAGLLARKPAKLVAVALANKMARIAWKLMVSGEIYATGRMGATTAA